MKIGIMSDVHGNLEALSAAMDIFSENMVEDIYCLGDTVGYGPNPSECIEIVRRRTRKSVLGNHDAAIIGKEDPHRFNRYALISNIWTGENLTDDDKDWLLGLPLTMSTESNCFMVHSAPYNPGAFNYILSPRDAMLEFGEFDERICFIGHSHKPAVFSSNDRQHIPSHETVPLDPSKRYIVICRKCRSAKRRRPERLHRHF
jgi:predicted phosphodiesterase